MAILPQLPQDARWTKNISLYLTRQLDNNSHAACVVIHTHLDVKEGDDVNNYFTLNTADRIPC